MTNIIKTGKRILKILLIINIIFAIVNISHAMSFSSIIESGRDFATTGKEEAEYKHDTEAIKTTISGIFSVLFPLGVATSVIVGGVLGIKFMIASAEDKAKIKEMLVPYTVGCILIFGATGIWNIVVDIGSKIVNERGYGSAEQVQQATHDLINGELDLTKLSNAQIVDLYNSQGVATELDGKTGNSGDYRMQSKLTLEEAINDLSEYKQKIYNEAKRRNLLDETGRHLKK